MVKLELYWESNRDWYHYDGWTSVLNDEEPEEAKRSYRVYLQQLLDIDKTDGQVPCGSKEPGRR